MNKSILGVLLVLAVIADGCSKNLLPTSPSDPDQPSPSPILGPPPSTPVKDLEPKTSPDGGFTITFKRATIVTPGGTAHVGNPGEIWVDVQNNTDTEIALCAKVVDSIYDDPRVWGKSSNLFGGCRVFRPHYSMVDMVLGFSKVGQPEEIPILRLGATTRDGIAHNQPPLWVIDYDLHWHILP